MPSATPDSPMPLLNAARDAVAAAGAVCRRLQSTLDLSRPIVKADESPVTLADLAAQAVVAHVLTRSLGPIRLVGEESAALLRREDHAHLLQTVLEAVRPVWPGATAAEVLDAIDLGVPTPAGAGDRFWTIDPIDGTKGFLRRQQYAVCLGLIDRGVPVLGALSCPNLSLDNRARVDVPDPRGSLYLATREPRTVLELPADDPAAAPRTISAREAARVPADRPIVICSSVVPSHSSAERLTRILTALGLPHRLERLDSQCKYALVARGQADALVRLPGRSSTSYYIWDHAAGACIAEAAGCIVSDARGRPLDFSTGTRLTNNVGIVCAAPWLHGRLIEAIAAAGVIPS